MHAILSPSGHSPSAGSPVPAPAMVGRCSELRRIAGHHREACEGRGGLVLVTGPAGAGKTRLVRELAASLVGTGTEVVTGRCYDVQPAVPYGPFLDAVQARVRAHGAAEVREWTGSTWVDAKYDPGAGFWAADYMGRVQSACSPQFTIVSNFNGLCLDTDDPNSGRNLYMFHCYGVNHPWQRFNSTPSGELRAFGDKCVDAYSVSANAKVYMYTCHGGPNQKWDWDVNTGRWHSRANPGLCLDISGANPAVGARIILWTCHGGANQSWHMRDYT